MIRFSHMCDRCLRLLGDDEPMFGFKLVDDEDNVKVLKGHEGCVKEMEEIIIQIYAQKENRNEESIED